MLLAVHLAGLLSSTAALLNPSTRAPLACHLLKAYTRLPCVGTQICMLSDADEEEWDEVDAEDTVPVTFLCLCPFAFLSAPLQGWQVGTRFERMV